MTGKPRVLIVDDAQINRLILSRALKDEYETVTAVNGQEALERLGAYPDIIAVLLDLRMPVMDGYQLMRAVRSDERHRDLALIAITGSEDTDSEVKALEAGANDFVQKPFKAEVVKARLKNALSLHEALELARIDGLTQLFNRTAFNTEADRYFKSIAGTPEKAAVFMIDADNFKSANDTFGHEYGDQLLAKLAEILREKSGKGISGRLGGDEFIVLLKDIPDERTASEVAEGIIRDFRGAGEDERPGATCSIGISLCPKHASERSALYFLADEALYEAKRRGKGCYAVYASSLADFSSHFRVSGDWILDNLDAYIYICNANNHQIYYANTKAEQLLARHPGAKCFCRQIGLAPEDFGMCGAHPLDQHNTQINLVARGPEGKKLHYLSRLINWNGRLARLTMAVPLE